MAVAEADLRKLVHDPIELFTRMIQPVLWLDFWAGFSRARAIPTGNRIWTSYRRGFSLKAFYSARFSMVFR